MPLGSSAIPSGGPAVGQVQQALSRLFETWAALRPSWFMRNLSHADAASVLSEVTGRPVTHRRLTCEQLRDRLAQALPPPEFAAVLATLDGAIAEGAEGRVTDAVERLTGRPPRSLRAHVERAWTSAVDGR